MYFKPHEEPNFQNLQSYLPLELQHSQPKKASMTIGGVMGPPLYTVSGQISNIEKGKEKEGPNGQGEEGEEAGEEKKDGEVESEEGENSHGKRTRSATNGGSEPKKSRVWSYVNIDN